MIKQGLFYIFFISLLIFSGCNNNLNIIEGVQVFAEPNLETVKVQLDFGNLVQSDLGGSYAIKDYGTIEVNPWTPNSPFNVGFRLNMSIFNDQDLVGLDPVTTLPSGQNIPIPNLNRAFVRVKMEPQMNPNFDIYLYVDIAGGEWMGVALTLKFIDNKVFPSGLVVNQRFLNDPAGNAQVVGSFFGPGVDGLGRLTTPGGIAVFANVKSIIANSPKTILKKQKFDGKYFFEGALARYYETHPKEAQNLGVAFRESLNNNRSK